MVGGSLNVELSSWGAHVVSKGDRIGVFTGVLIVIIQRKIIVFYIVFILK